MMNTNPFFVIGNQLLARLGGIQTSNPQENILFQGFQDYMIILLTLS